MMRLPKLFTNGLPDWKNASYMLRLKTDCPTDTVCFHAQQCVEKYIKALLVLKGTDFPKTHDIARLMTLLPAIWRPRITDAEQEKLTDYAAVSRYPGDYEPIALSEAQNAVKIARRIRKEIRAALPKLSLKIRKL
jgi:HEPN domain-containing protein